MSTDVQAAIAVLVMVALTGCLANVGMAPDGPEKAVEFETGVVLTYGGSGSATERLIALKQFSVAVVAQNETSFSFAGLTRDVPVINAIAGHRYWFTGALDRATYSGIPNETLLSLPLEVGKQWPSRLVVFDTVHFRVTKNASLTGGWGQAEGFIVEGRAENFPDFQARVEFVPDLNVITRYELRNDREEILNLELLTVRKLIPGELPVIATVEADVAAVARGRSPDAVTGGKTSTLSVQSAQAMVIDAGVYAPTCNAMLPCPAVGSGKVTITSPNGTRVLDKSMTLQREGWVQVHDALDGKWSVHVEATGDVTTVGRLYSLSLQSFPAGAAGGGIATGGHAGLSAQHLFAAN